MRLARLGVGVVTVLVGLGGSVRSAWGAGGIVATPAESARVVEARIAVSGAPSVTWVDLRVVGETGGFVWVLPLPPGAVADDVDDAWLDALDESTATIVVAPPAAACDSTRGEHATYVGARPSTRPFAVHLAPDDASLEDALRELGFVAPDTMLAAVKAHASRGGTTLVMAFAGGGDVRTRGVRFASLDAGAEVSSLPMLLTHAGAAPVRVVAFAIAEGRAAFGDVPALPHDELPVVWERGGRSTYEAARDAALARAPETFVLEAAGASMLFGDIAGRYGSDTCSASWRVFAGDPRRVEPGCMAGALARPDARACEALRPALATALAADTFTCGTRDDLAAALWGKVPSRTWVTRATGAVAARATRPDVPWKVAPGPARDRRFVARALAFTCAQEAPLVAAPLAEPARDEGCGGDPPGASAARPPGGAGGTSAGARGTVVVARTDGCGSSEPSSTREDGCGGSEPSQTRGDGCSSGSDDGGAGEGCGSDDGAEAGDDCDSAGSDGGDGCDGASGGDDGCSSGSGSGASSGGCSGGGRDGCDVDAKPRRTAEGTGSAERTGGAERGRVAPARRSPVSRAVLALALLVLPVRRLGRKRRG